jgi:N-acetylglucosaminyldiphosphoundecaprenol N-acetyl-beta-D-mannosaminyltransferase
VRVLEVKINNLTRSQIEEKLNYFLRGQGQHQIVLPYSLFLMEAQKNRSFKNILNEASLSIADGFGPVLAARILNKENLRRLTGVDFIKLVCQAAQKNNQSVFLFGGKKGVAAKTAQALKNKCLGLRVAGLCDGFGDYDRAVNLIKEARPDILLVALGMVTQEKWIAQNLSKMPSVKIAAGVGGAFDFISGNVKRAPAWMQKIGLEWLWRVAVQPARIGKVTRAIAGLWWLILKFKMQKIK